LFRAYEPDLAICTGFPWLISQEAIDVPRLGIGQRAPVVPSALPRPLPDRVGDSQR
jgi:hypothetical protein